MINEAASWTAKFIINSKTIKCLNNEGLERKSNYFLNARNHTISIIEAIERNPGKHKIWIINNDRILQHPVFKHSSLYVRTTKVLKAAKPNWSKKQKYVDNYTDADR
jgi:hypothetical protein